MAEPLIYNIFKEIVSALNGAGFKKVFLSNRPSMVDKAVDSFVVVELPDEIQNTVKGDDEFMCKTTGVIYIFRREKTDGTPNIKDQLDLVQSAYRIFPINSTHTVCTNPSRRLKGSDNNGFQVTTITFDIRTKVNSYQI